MLQDLGSCSASPQALHEQDHRELEKLVTVLPARLSNTVLEQPDFSQVSFLFLRSAMGMH